MLVPYLKYVELACLELQVSLDLYYYLRYRKLCFLKYFGFSYLNIFQFFGLNFQNFKKISIKEHLNHSIFSQILYAQRLKFDKIILEIKHTFLN